MKLLKVFAAIFVSVAAALVAFLFITANTDLIDSDLSQLLGKPKRNKVEIYTAYEGINLNTATAEELCTLNGIGQARAEAIIRYRENNGGFISIEELLQIKGIGEGIYAKIKDFICC